MVTIGKSKDGSSFYLTETQQLLPTSDQRTGAGNAMTFASGSSLANDRSPAGLIIMEIH